MNRNILEVVLFGCVPLYIDCLSDLHKKLQAASTYDTNVEYQIKFFCFLITTANRHTHDQLLKI